MNEETRLFAKLGSALSFGVVCLAALFLWGCPTYNVWERHMAGQAELAQAQSNRQIQTQEAHAKMESAKLLAEAEVERAKGVAKANEIIGKSLENNEAYLHYLWIDSLHNHPGASVIYVPTEANLPILEAGHRPERKPLLPERSK